jgi:hypothetical protein
MLLDLGCDQLIVINFTRSVSLILTAFYQWCSSWNQIAKLTWQIGLTMSTCFLLFSRFLISFSDQWHMPWRWYSDQQRECGLPNRKIDRGVNCIKFIVKELLDQINMVKGMWRFLAIHPPILDLNTISNFNCSQSYGNK